MRVNVPKTGVRAASTLVVVWLLSATAFCQSVLNFPARELTSLSITNTTPYSADVKFTLYASDGSPVSAGALNPTTRHIPPRGQNSLSPSQLFKTPSGIRQDTWIQATSTVSGLEGFYFSGSFVSPFMSGGDAVKPQLSQTMSLGTSNPNGSLVITNPTAQNAAVTVSFSGAGETVVRLIASLPAHAQMVLPIPPRSTSARIVSDAGILATMPNGQASNAQGMALVAPYFRNGENTRSELVLNNASNSSVSVTVRFFSNLGSVQSLYQSELKAGASSSPAFAPTGEGWLLVEASGPILIEPSSVIS